MDIELYTDEILNIILVLRSIKLKLWWFMAILPKFYLQTTFILADLLCKAANLAIFCAKRLKAVICQSFVLYSKKLLYSMAKSFVQ